MALITLALLRGDSLVAGLHGPAGTPGKDRLRAGAHAVNASPTKFPVIVNAMFTERTADKVTDPLLAKAFVFEDSSTRLAIGVVDSCMAPRDLANRAKELAAQATGSPIEWVLGSVTHTRSALSAMGRLGSRVDSDIPNCLPRAADP